MKERNGMLETTADAYITLRLLAYEVEQSAQDEELKVASKDSVESFLTAKAILLGMELCLVEREWAESLVRLVAEDVDCYENALSQVEGLVSNLDRRLENYNILEDEYDIS